MTKYFQETFTTQEVAILKQYVTNTTKPVFALKNLPQTTSAALFARYSRTPKSLRRLFLDEFNNASTEQDLPNQEVGLVKAQGLFARVLAEYGDDSVAQLASVHVACEQVSQLLAKQIERGRLGAYLEQSTRYIPYTDKRAGSYRYLRDSTILASPFGDQYLSIMDNLFDTYCELIPLVQDHLDKIVPSAKDPKARLRAIKALALDLLRGLLPASTVSNVGMCATPQSLEQLILRLRSSSLKEANQYANLLTTELQKVIPSFLTRLDRADRGGVWEQYKKELAADAIAANKYIYRHYIGGKSNSSNLTPSIVDLVEWDKDAEDKIMAASLFTTSELSYRALQGTIPNLSKEEKSDLWQKVVGTRRNRRHHPNRGFEQAFYTFEITSDYGAFRDLQRHRMLTVQWQNLTPNYGYDIPKEILTMPKEVAQKWIAAVTKAEALYRELFTAGLEDQAQYCVTLGHKMRYMIKLNAREAMHMLELRTSPQGHSSYRQICQEMHRLIKEKAGHEKIASSMKFMNMEDIHLPRYSQELGKNENLA